MILATAVVLLIVYDHKPIKQMLHIENHSLVKRESHGLIKRIDSSFFPRDIKIVALGDSLTSGFGDQSGNSGYTTVLEQMLSNQRSINDVDVRNFGVGGIHSKRLVEELNRKIVQDTLKDADYIVITIGGNDVIQVVQENFLNLTTEMFEEKNEEFSKNLNLIIHKLKFYNPNAKLFFVGIYNPFSTLFASVPEIDQIITDWNEDTVQVLSKYENTHFIPMSDVFKGNEKDYLYKDLIHPNEKGYENMAIRILTYLDQYDESSTYVIGETEGEEY
jgi:lysophospholipase L1-like esterase